jgi:hypothetical protein
MVTFVDPNAINTTLQDDNPFGVNQAAPLYATSKAGDLWLPPFTLTNSSLAGSDILVLIGFFVFLMTPSAVKMAQDWLQVKESPYTAEAFGNLGVGVKGGTLPFTWGWKSIQEEMAQRRSAAHLAGAIRGTKNPTEQNPVD